MSVPSFALSGPVFDSIEELEDEQHLAEAHSASPAAKNRSRSSSSTPSPSSLRMKKSRVEESQPSSYGMEDAVGSADEPAFTFRSTRERVIQAEASRAGAELAGQVIHMPKEKTGYQLYHMHRVAEIKEEAGVKHHEAFKRAARDWTKLPNEEKEWYNGRADKKPVPKAAKPSSPYEGHLVTDLALRQHVQHHVDVLSAVLVTNVMGATPFSPSKPSNLVVQQACEWLCSRCGNGDAGAPGGVCLMCAAFGDAYAPM